MACHKYKLAIDNQGSWKIKEDNQEKVTGYQHPAPSVLESILYYWKFSFFLGFLGGAGVNFFTIFASIIIKFELYTSWAFQKYITFLPLKNS